MSDPRRDAAVAKLIRCGELIQASYSTMAELFKEYNEASQLLGLQQAAQQLANNQTHNPFGAMTSTPAPTQENGSTTTRVQVALWQNQNSMSGTIQVGPSGQYKLKCVLFQPKNPSPGSNLLASGWVLPSDKEVPAGQQLSDFSVGDVAVNSVNGVPVMQIKLAETPVNYLFQGDVSIAANQQRQSEKAPHFKGEAMVPATLLKPDYAHLFAQQQTANMLSSTPAPADPFFGGTQQPVSDPLFGGTGSGGTSISSLLG